MLDKLHSNEYTRIPIPEWIMTMFRVLRYPVKSLSKFRSSRGRCAIRRLFYDMEPVEFRWIWWWAVLGDMEEMESVFDDLEYSTLHSSRFYGIGEWEMIFWRASSKCLCYGFGGLWGDVDEKAMWVIIWVELGKVVAQGVLARRVYACCGIKRWIYTTECYGLRLFNKITMCTCRHTWPFWERCQ